MKINQIKGEIEILTGLHIGGGDDVMKIGGIDNPIIKDANTNHPYIPGSSIKGVFRTAILYKLLQKRQDIKSKYWCYIKQQVDIIEKLMEEERKPRELQIMPYSVIKKLKPRTIKLFVSIAIERFAQTDESKLFFKDSEVDEKKITKIIEKVGEVKKVSSLEEWN